MDSPLRREARCAQFRAPPECVDRLESGRQELPLHALIVTEESPKAVLKDSRLAIAQLEKRIDRLMAWALLLIGKHTELQRVLTLLTGIKGIAETSAVALMGELFLLPPGLSHREWVKFAGLDPKAFDSGKSVHKKTRLSKAGNRYIRSALYMPALSAKTHDPYVGGYFRTSSRSTLS